MIIQRGVWLSMGGVVIHGGCVWINPLKLRLFLAITRGGAVGKSNVKLARLPS